MGSFLAKAPLPLRSVSFVSFGVNPSWVFKGPIKCPLFYCRPIKVLAREQWLAKSDLDSLSFSATLDHSSDLAHRPSLFSHGDAACSSPQKPWFRTVCV